MRIRDVDDIKFVVPDEYGEEYYRYPEDLSAEELEKVIKILVGYLRVADK